MVGNDPRLNACENPHIIYLNGMVTPHAVTDKPHASLCILDDVKIHKEAWDGLKSIMAGRGGILRYVGGQIKIPAVPTVIITNSIPWYDKMISSNEWMLDIYFWRLEEGVLLMPEEYRKKRDVESYVVKAKKVLKIVGPGLVGVNESTQLMKVNKSRAAFIDCLDHGKPLDADALSYF